MAAWKLAARRRQLQTSAAIFEARPEHGSSSSGRFPLLAVLVPPLLQLGIARTPPGPILGARHGPAGRLRARARDRAGAAREGQGRGCDGGARAPRRRLAQEGADGAAAAEPR
ncbi:unnamed protein product [Prorocentrum cordatum]|uniref:Uncharacterized protein n=1 Tax=Prorocentrum cordatum TaxID=2364126 RepID=A0ABN9PJH8_9DINO|nr:unnamed protein product [Polarella glacialis]CAK0798351.1 unnamed protein product [Polarella glacialis]